MNVNVAAPAMNQAPFRSALSLAFEEHWRRLAAGRAMPLRADFNPMKAARFLADVVLLELQDGPEPKLIVRLAGTAVETRIQRKISGTNYLDHVSPEIAQGVVASTRQMLQLPCGLWQIMPAHYERGFAQYMELTAFPLAHEEGRAPLLLCLVLFPEALLAPKKVTGMAMMVDTAAHYRFIDTGRGVPG